MSRTPSIPTLTTIEWGESPLSFKMTIQKMPFGKNPWHWKVWSTADGEDKLLIKRKAATEDKALAEAEDYVENDLSVRIQLAAKMSELKATEKIEQMRSVEADLAAANSPV